MSLTVPSYLDCGLGWTSLGGFDPSGPQPDIASMGIKRLDRAYQFDLIRPISQIKNDIGAAVSGIKTGNLVLDIEAFDANSTPSLHQSAQFESVCDAFKSWNSNPLKLWWFGGPLVGGSYTDPSQLNIAHQANKDFLQLHIADHVDGIAFGMYLGASPSGQMSDLAGFRDATLGGLSLCDDLKKPVIAYIWPRYFPTQINQSNNRMSRTDWQYTCLMARTYFEQKRIVGVCLYTEIFDQDKKFNPALDQPMFDDFVNIMS